MKKHPEQQDDEIYFGNWEDTSLRIATFSVKFTEWHHASPYGGQLLWKTVRYGSVPRNTDGTPWAFPTNYRPAFAKRSEIEAERDKKLAKGEIDAARTLTELLERGYITFSSSI